MKRKKNKSYSFNENDREIIFRYLENDKIMREIIIPNNVKPRIRYPLPNTKRLLENAEYFSSRGLAGGTVNGFLNKYIRDRKSEIDEQILETRKSLKRIRKALECIDIVENLKKSI